MFTVIVCQITQHAQKNYNNIRIHLKNSHNLISTKDENGFSQVKSFGHLLKIARGWRMNMDSSLHMRTLDEIKETIISCTSYLRLLMTHTHYVKIMPRYDTNMTNRLVHVTRENNDGNAHTHTHTHTANLRM